MSEIKPLPAPSILADTIGTDSDNKNTADTILYCVSEILKMVMETAESDSVCTCEARVICTNATEDSKPHHMKAEDGLVHMGNIEELNRTNIEPCENFEGCTKSPDGKCMIAQKYKEWIADQEWKAVDETSSQGDGKEKLNQETSYMVCTEYGGAIYFYDDGQVLRPYINGEALLYLSNEYLEWMEKAEGFTGYPYLDEADGNTAKKRCNVTLGIGFTFDSTGRHWDILRDILGWTDEEITEIINGLYNTNNKKDFSKDPRFRITRDQAMEITKIALEREYIPNLNAAIMAYNAEQEEPTSYTQRELEAMLDYSYNNGLAKKSDDNTYSTSINDEDRIIYYYLRRDQKGGVEAVKKWTDDEEMRRRLNQMNLFFNPDDEKAYDFKEDLDQLRDSLGF